jgi:hypothetical protein
MSAFSLAFRCPGCALHGGNYFSQGMLPQMIKSRSPGVATGGSTEVKRHTDKSIKKRKSVKSADACDHE